MIGRALLALYVVSLVACSGDDVTGPEGVVGTYLLQSVDGQAVPLVLQQLGDYRLEFTSGSMTFDQDMTCGDSLITTETNGYGNNRFTSTTTRVCTYTLNSGAITISWPLDGGSASGAITDSQLTLTDEGVVSVFRR